MVALAVLLMLLAPAPASASQAAGVQVHPLWEGVDRAQAARQLDDAAAAGARIVRVDVGWSSLQPDGPRRWSRWYLHRLDAVVDGARRRRLRPLLMVFGSPCWASSAPARLRQGCRGRWWDRVVDRWAPRRARDYAKAMAFLVRRYGRRVRAWEIWNEPNQTAFFRAPDPARAYAHLLRAAHRAMKRADHRATVVGGVLAEADVRFTERLYRFGVRGAFDALSIHPYSGDKSPLDPRAGDASTHSFVRGVPAVRAVMLRHHDPRPLWLTEFGWSTSTGRGGPSYTNGVDPATQARFLLEAFTRLRAWHFVDVAIWYTLADTSTDVSRQLDNFGLFNADGSPKPSFYSFRWAAAALRARS